MIIIMTVRICLRIYTESVASAVIEFGSFVIIIRSISSSVL